MKCSRCQPKGKQYKAGFNTSVRQRYSCGEYNRAYTPEPKQHGYSLETRLLAIRIYMKGSSYGSIALVLKVNPQSVANWVSQYTANCPNHRSHRRSKKDELDELYAFVGKKKNEIHVLTVIDRDTHCVVSWDVVLERTSEALQACLEHAPQTRQYYSDAFPVYDILYYGAPYEMGIYE